MKKLSSLEYSRWTKYRKQGGTNLNRCKVDQCNLSYGSENHTKHEIRKYLLCNDLHNMGHKFITEAVPCSNVKIRHDIVDLSDGVVYEVFNTCLSKNLKGCDYKVVNI